MRNSSKIVFYLLITYFIVGCKNDNKFSDIPTIEYKNYEIITDSAGRKSIELQLYFTDKDGDIGSDEQPQFSANDTKADSCNKIKALHSLFIKYFEKKNQQYVEILPKDTLNCLLFSKQLPNLTSKGSNKTLEGDIFHRFEYFGYPSQPNIDSIKFEVYLVDRAGHQSNIAQSAAIATPQ